MAILCPALTFRRAPWYLECSSCVPPLGATRSAEMHRQTMSRRCVKNVCRSGRSWRSEGDTRRRRAWKANTSSKDLPSHQHLPIAKRSYMWWKSAGMTCITPVGAHPNSDWLMPFEMPRTRTAASDCARRLGTWRRHFGTRWNATKLSRRPGEQTLVLCTLACDRAP
ncbi:hypothetical protein BDY21DRAFT_353516 [Lineolata rhizophorae]|uniref:Uncharacterized protein n=1 Tax=Lineolata rhizophorae TaxID=578093 RepID=A0A6A6NR38_9PEZI|nr:hypothetical protein BDY21DRAFT_353516 [Lineolata rhizophorae]